VPNLIAQLQAILTVQNNLVSPPPYITNFDFQNPTQNATSSFFDSFFQATSAGVTVPLPAAAVSCLMVQNLHASAIVNVEYTPFGGTITTLGIGPQGVFIFYDPLGAAPGISALILNGIAVTVPCMVFASK
jgi:hypothetical protein